MESDVSDVNSKAEIDPKEATGDFKDDGPEYRNEVRCTYEKCTKASNEFMIQCKECENYTHFACTRLPPTQLQRFMTKGYKRYNCEKCYKLPIHEDYTNNCFEQ